MNLFVEGKDLRESNTNHINIDEAPKLHKAIIEHVLATCPPRAAWAAVHPDRSVTPLTAGVFGEETARMAAAARDNKTLARKTVAK
jgi:hypothetical protein